MCIRGTKSQIRTIILVSLAILVTVSALEQKRAYRSHPFFVALTLAESTTCGSTATDPELSWVSTMADLNSIKTLL